MNNFIPTNKSDEVENFLERFRLPKLIQEEMTRLHITKLN